MKTAAKSLEFEKAALLRDQVIELRKAMLDDQSALHEFAQSSYGSLGWAETGAMRPRGARPA
jgi:excinuclease UvrABC nuclease subunit